MTRLALMLSSVVIFVVVNPTTAQTDTTFTYQGSLRDGGTPASGFYNIDFSLWDAPADGNQIDSSVMFNQVPVSEGLFTVELDFGANAFDNTDRWLEIAVDGNELSPRQPITRAPYSIQTRGIVVDENNNVGIGTTVPDDRLHARKQTTTANLPERILVVDSHDDPNNFDLQTGSGAGIIFKVPYQSDSRVGAAIDAVRTTNVETNSSTALAFSTSANNEILNEAMRIDEFGHVGIGTATPNHPLHITSSTDGGVRVETTGAISNGDGVRSQVVGEGAWAIYGVALSGNGRAGSFFGDVAISGTLSKSGGAFKIDHPLDPTNKFLSHSFVESPDMMNIYNGNTILDGSGRATITLPDWFEALNREFRYQLTCIGGFATVYIESEIENNQFTIAGGKAGLKISWQVTGVRQDAWAEANRIPVEEQKVGFEAGHYLHPEVYDLDRSMSILAAREAHISVPEPIAAANEFQE